MSQRDLFAPEREQARDETPWGHIRFVSAGAGSGKTYRLTEELERALEERAIDPERVIATTFTVKAAAELADRVRERLIRGGSADLAERMAEALVGTVHAVCERLLRRFAFELGLSPAIEVVAVEDAARFFEQGLDAVLTAARARALNALAERLEIEDWERSVKDIADKARANDIAPDRLRAMGRKNAGALLGHFPRPAPKSALAQLDRAFFAAVKEAADGMRPVSKASRDYVEAAQTTLFELRRHRCPWSRWAKLATAQAGKRDGGDAFAERVRLAAAHYPAHPALHRDVRAFVESVFAVAADALTAFQDLKRERRLIDFTDMEQLTLRALDLPAVAERLGDEIDLLLVDEFQDTNPMQLALFMKLSRFAREVIFVGDAKQAIYAFRGSDPDLVFAALEGIAAAGGRMEVLPKSYRSRGDLVAYVNDVFTRAFAADDIEPARVELAAVRGDPTGAPAVVTWRIAGAAEAQHRAIARGVAALVAGGFPVVDAVTGATRPVAFADVAVVAATNDHVEGIARALRDERVPMKMSVSGLLSTPEIALARSCLRRLNDTSDTLAAAEIVALTTCEEPEIWLADRLRRLAAGAARDDWDEAASPVLARLVRLRADMATQSPVEIVARVLEYVGIRARVTAWGPDAIKAAQRSRNLDALLDLAVMYERHCTAQHEAASLTGLLFWIENPVSPELDLQPTVTAGDAVHVLTYHRAKGLEWPVVVASDHGYRWSSTLWDVRVESGGAFDLGDPLAGREIRCWPYPFGRVTRGVDLVSRVAGSEEGRRCGQRRASELRRLAYVGLTRARDALVLALPARLAADAWLESFGGSAVVPSGDSFALASGRVIPTAVVAIDDDGAAPNLRPFAPRWFEDREPAAGLLPAVASPSLEPARVGARIVAVEELGSRIDIGRSDPTALGLALHRVFAAELVDPGRQSDAAIEAQLAAFGSAVDVRVAAARAAAERLRDHVRSLTPRAVHVEYPVAHLLADGRWMRGRIDLLVETANGAIVIDHKCSPRPRSDWPEEVKEYAGQLAAYRAALEAAGIAVTSTWIHFSVTGAMVEVAW